MESLQPHKRLGFTLIEILVVILIIGILAAYFGQSIFGDTADAKFAVVKTQLDETLPSAIVGYYASHITPTDHLANVTQDMVSRGVKRETPWGSKIYAVIDTTGANNGIAVYYPVKKTIKQSSIDHLFKSLTSTPGAMVKLANEQDHDNCPADTYCLHIVYRQPRR